MLAPLAPELDAVAEAATRSAAEAVRRQDAEPLPAASAPLLDLFAERHSAWKVRLFAS